MDDSMGAGLVAVIAVSGSIVFLSLQVHKRLLSDFMEKIELELGSGKDETKKRVRFCSQQVENRDRQVYEIENKKKASSSSSGGGSRSRSRSRVVRDNYKHGQMEEGGQCLEIGKLCTKESYSTGSYPPLVFNLAIFFLFLL